VVPEIDLAPSAPAHPLRSCARLSRDFACPHARPRKHSGPARSIQLSVPAPVRRSRTGPRPPAHHTWSAPPSGSRRPLPVLMFNVKLSPLPGCALLPSLRIERPLISLLPAAKSLIRLLLMGLPRHKRCACPRTCLGCVSGLSFAVEPSPAKSLFRGAFLTVQKAHSDRTRQQFPYLHPDTSCPRRLAGSPSVLRRLFQQINHITPALQQHNACVTKV